MIILLSPAKTLDFEDYGKDIPCTLLSLSICQGFDKRSFQVNFFEVGSLMNISPKLADLNRNAQQWKSKHDKVNSKQAILAFKGDVYEGLRAWEFNKSDFSYAQKYLRVLSGLYGILKPLDLIQPYRLEMGTVYPNPKGRDLYAFWGDNLADQINHDLKKNKSGYLVNLASQEYFKAAQAPKIDGEIISPTFLDEKNGKYKIISFFAKKARGYMAN